MDVNRVVFRVNWLFQKRFVEALSTNENVVVVLDEVNFFVFEEDVVVGLLLV